MKVGLFWKPAGREICVCVLVGHAEEKAIKSGDPMPMITLTEEGRRIFGQDTLVPTGIYQYFDGESGKDYRLGYTCGMLPEHLQGVLLTDHGIKDSNRLFNKRPLRIGTLEECRAQLNAG